MEKEKFIIQGLGKEKSLSGKIKISGSKNAVLPVMAASVLFEDGIKMTNVPLIKDLDRIKEIYEGLGIKMDKLSNDSYFINTKKVRSGEMDEKASKMMRASIIFAGPILARFGELVFPHPGGCVIGARPIDLFLEGFEKMGATWEHKNEKYYIKVKGKKLKGANIFFKKLISVTATETFIMAGVLAEGKTVLSNVAMEPEIISLIDYLNKCGAKIKGAGTPVLEIKGGDLLKSNGFVYENIPDRIETGSFLILGALCASDLEICNCDPFHLEVLIETLKDSGVNIELGKNYIKVNNKNKENYKTFDIKTHEYPGFPTDLQSPILIYLTQVNGESLVFETIFEGRLNYVDDLIKMGADIKLWDALRATVKGKTYLKGRELDGPDIRTGFAFVIAALVAENESIINNIYYIDRGYENIENRLQAIGANIERVIN
ncbi:MAG: UDP-N-acetylglucosamine 1-carboxyvinyltransferase [Candidatus Pacebacteria bacterium]|nr:UDP-N-acetylglucosamine 1-carboxyvinyltransferase [Candidatus Paceibacterota bacterium]